MKELHDNSKIVLRPNNNDVLCGRGSRSYCHPGNIQFRKIVSNHKHRYNTSDNKFKPFIAEGIVNLLKRRSPPGRYLSEDKERRIWIEINHNAAVQKTQQALREKTKWAKNDSESKKADEREKCLLGQVPQAVPQRMAPKNFVASFFLEKEKRDEKIESSHSTPVIGDQSLLLKGTQHLNDSLAPLRIVSIENKLNKVGIPEELSIAPNSMNKPSFEMMSTNLRKEIYLLDAFKNRIVAEEQSMIPSRTSTPRCYGNRDFDLRNSNISNQYTKIFQSQLAINSGKRDNEVVNGSMDKKTNDFSAQLGCSKFMYQILLESLTGGEKI